MIRNKLGLHLRPIRLLVDLANKFQSNIRIVRDEREVDGKSFLDVMTLAAPAETVLMFKAAGPDASEALDAIERLVESKFDEE
ncbi:MAG: HPr family phosphocarrier protein [Planctomycetota bacterium]